MKPYKVTITGADDTTDIADLVNLSQKYPKVEWGILNTRKALLNGVSRQPGLAWRKEFALAAKKYNMKYALHLCNSSVRELMFVPDYDVVLLKNMINDNLFEGADRIQLNTGRELMYISPDIALKNIKRLGKTIIFQWDGVNGSLAYAAKFYGIEAHILHDASCGRGLVPSTWEKEKPSFTCGWAGGIGPHNVNAVLSYIVKNNNSLKTNSCWWIDMETKIRSNDGFQLELEAIQTVLEVTK